MAAIRAATEADLPAISRYLAERMGHGYPPARYRRFFEYQWAPRPNLGFLIEEGTSVRGFIGAIYSVRKIRGADHRICNINSWSVDEAHRKLSLAMAMRLLAQPGYSFTCFSPAEVVVECLRFFKFETWHVEKVLFTPAHGLRNAVRRPRVRVLTPESAGAAFEAALDDTQRQIHRDHAPYRCGQMLIERGDRRSYVVTVRRGRGARAFADVLHASDPALFVEAIAYTHLPLWRAHRTFLTGIDQRFVEHVGPTTYVYRGLRPLQYRSASLTLHDIDTLYSELVPIFA
jgi:hypothetical protein